MNIDLAVKCEECGEYLTVKEITYERCVILSVEVCEKCNREAYEEGCNT